MSPTQRKARFPLVSQQIELHLESRWHYLLRRAIWILAEMASLSLPPTATDYYLLATTPWPAWQAVVIFFEWDLEKLNSADVDLEELLKSTGVTQQWLGPPGYDIPMGGHAYLGKAQAQLEELP